jgi:Mrp family chromosome partitioning ATPase
VTIHDVVMAVRQRWAALLICIVLGGGAGLGIALIPAATYSSMARVLIAVPDVAQDSLQLPGGLSATQRTTNYANLATSTTVLDGVIKDLDLPTTVAKLTRQVQVDVPIGTTVVQITASAGTAKGAQQIAEAIAERLSATAGSLEGALGVSDGTVVVAVADPAPLPPSADPSGAVPKTALGIIAGLIIGAGVLWLLEYLDGSVRKPQDLAAVTNASVLGAVTRAHGDRLPATGSAAESFRAIRTALPPAAGDALVVVVTGVSAKDASAPVAANLAAAQARAGRRTLLVDADLQGAAVGTLLGLSRGRGLADALAAPGVVAPVTTRWEPGAVDVLTAGAAADTAADLLQTDRVGDVLADLRDKYESIVVSAPAALDSVAAATVGAAADGVILVATWGATTLAAASHAGDRVAMNSATVAGSVLVDVPRYRRDADFVPAPR